MSTASCPRPTRTRAARLLAGALGAGVLAALVPTSADAHVGLSADTTAAGAYALLTLAVPHGCDGAATTQVTVQVPVGINAVTPTVSPLWAVRKHEEQLRQPVTTADGEQLTRRVAEVVWTARSPLPDGYRDALSLQVQLPAGSAGQTLVFPTVQTCTKGETAWTQLPAPGQDQHELEHPAPSLTVTAAAAADHHAGAGEEAADPDAAPAVAGLLPAEVTGPTAQAPGTDPSTGTLGLVAGLLGLAAGVTALLRTRTATARDGRA